ncbi:hypothetical protein GCM10029992_36880 [Glycomyces albus]
MDMGLFRTSERQKLKDALISLSNSYMLVQLGRRNELDLAPEIAEIRDLVELVRNSNGSETVERAWRAAQRDPVVGVIWMEHRGLKDSWVRFARSVLDGSYQVPHEVPVAAPAPQKVTPEKDLSESFIAQMVEIGVDVESFERTRQLVEGGRLEEAEALLGQAAESGDLSAKTLLAGLCYDRGDLVDAERWLRSASGQGYDLATFNLATLLTERGETRRRKRSWSG